MTYFLSDVFINTNPLYFYCFSKINLSANRVKSYQNYEKINLIITL